MLAHPTLDQLHALGLHGVAKGFKELEHRAEARGLEHAEWLGSAARIRGDAAPAETLRDSRRGPPVCAIQPASKTSTTRARAASTGPCSSSSRPATGLQSAATC